MERARWRCAWGCQGVAALCLALACPTAVGAGVGEPAYSAYAAVDNEKLRAMLSQMTTEEQFLQTCIDNQCAESQLFWLRCNPQKPPTRDASSKDASLFASMSPAAGDIAFELRPNVRLGIRGMRLRDGPKGMTCNNFGEPCPFDGRAPAFPAQSLRATTWDVELEEEFGAAIGEIAHALDIHGALLPTINVLPWLNWGRGQESFGEDPFFNGKMGAAVVRGVQKDGKVMATAKHFLANNIENSRWWVSAEMTDKMLHEVYLKAWAVIVEESAPELVMTAYNRVQGKYSFADPKFIDLLRSKLGFQGSVMTDWIATWELLTSGLVVTGGRTSPYWGQVGFLKPQSIYGAGVDMEMPFCSKNRDAVSQLQACSISDEEACEARRDLQKAAGRLLRSKMRYGLVGTQPPKSPRVLWDNNKYGELALRIAQRGMVLLRNQDAFLPKRPAEVRKLVILGSADVLEEGDKGSSNVKPSVEPTTVLEGLVRKYGYERTTFIKDSSQNESDSLIQAADLVVIDVGYDWTFEGEFIPPAVGGDRKYLGLHKEHVALIDNTTRLNSKVVVLIASGQNVVVEDFVDKVRAILWIGYPGPMGGRAVADILAGDVNPSGRLSSVTPKTAQDYVPLGTNLEPWHDVAAAAYPYLYGFKHMWANGIVPRYPLGHGLSYTVFEHAPPNLFMDSSSLFVTVRAKVANTGAVHGIETVQVYGTCLDCKHKRLPIVLLGFAKVPLEPGAQAEAKIVFSAKELAVYDEKSSRWLLEKGRYRALVGPRAEASSLQGVEYTIESEVSHDYLLANPSPDAFSDLGSEAKCEPCTPEPDKIEAFALPSQESWHPILIIAKLVWRVADHKAAFAVGAVAYFFACCWCCWRCCCSCRRRCRSAVRANKTKDS